MEQVTLAFAILLGVGLVIAQAGKFLKLPSVTGYILAGLLLGPSGLGVISEEISSEKLRHFTEIALMLVAFGIGEHIEFKEVKKIARQVGYISLAETTCVFLLIAISTFAVSFYSGAGGEEWGVIEYASLAILLGSVAVATAPAATLHVLQELGARGQLTSTLLTVVAVDNGIAIIYFSIAMAVVSNILLSDGGSFVLTLYISIQEIVASLFLGVVTGLVIDFALNKLNRKGEMLSAGLALLLLCGESARLLELSSLLAGMAAGCVIVNRDKRDVRLFEALHDFEPPVYILFFTLAGTHLDISSLAGAGIIGLVYFIFRIAGKIGGTYYGAGLAGSPPVIRRYLGFALAPQAGVAIGLIFLIANNDSFSEYAAVVTPVVLTGVIISELVGPLLARFAILSAGEEHEQLKKRIASGKDGEDLSEREIQAKLRGVDGISIRPWKWRKLTPLENRQGVVAFGAGHPATVSGLARLATIFAHHFGAEPMSIRVIPPDQVVRERDWIFTLEEAEVRSIGYPLQKKIVRSNNVAQGILEAASSNETRCLLLGYPIAGTIQDFEKVLEQVAARAECAVVVVRFFGELHTKKILVPFVSMDQLDEVSAFVNALSRIGEHVITLLYILPYDCPEKVLQEKERQLAQWMQMHALDCEQCISRLVTSNARLHTVHEVAEEHDLVVMTAPPSRSPMRRLIFGSLADMVAKDCTRSVLIVHYPD